MVFRALPFDDAARVYRRLTGQQGLEPKRETLTIAEVYRIARRDGWTPPRARRRPGFHHVPDDSLETVSSTNEGASPAA